MRKYLPLILLTIVVLLNLIWVLPLSLASAESEEVPPEVQEEVDEYTEAYIACFPNGAPDSWVYTEHGFEDCLDADPNGPYGGWDPCNLEPNWWDEETNGVYNQLMDCGWDPPTPPPDETEWDFCKAEPDWWNEEMDGPYPQIAECGWDPTRGDKEKGDT